MLYQQRGGHQHKQKIRQVEGKCRERPAGKYSVVKHHRGKDGQVRAGLMQKRITDDNASDNRVDRPEQRQLLRETQVSADKAKQQRDQKQQKCVLLSVVLFKQLYAHTSGPCRREAGCPRQPEQARGVRMIKS